MKLFRYMPAMGWASFIFWLSHQPQWLLTPPPIWGIDKAAHFTVFGVLGYLFLWAGRTHSSQSFWMHIGWVCLYGVSDEWHQSFIPGRSSGLGDVLADCCGCLAVGWLWWIKSKALVSRRRSHDDSGF
jgi:VanZ family protein